MTSLCQPLVNTESALAYEVNNSLTLQKLIKVRLSLEPRVQRFRGGTNGEFADPRWVLTLYVLSR